MENEDYDIDAFENELLDAYFKFRSNLPMKDAETGLEYKKSFWIHTNWESRRR